MCEQNIIINLYCIFYLLISVFHFVLTFLNGNILVWSRWFIWRIIVILHFQCYIFWKFFYPYLLKQFTSYSVNKHFPWQSKTKSLSMPNQLDPLFILYSMLLLPLFNLLPISFSSSFRRCVYCLLMKFDG